MPVNIALKIAILETGKRQFQIAKRARIVGSKFSNIINGRIRPTPDEKERIAKALRRQVEDFWPERERLSA